MDFDIIYTKFNNIMLWMDRENLKSYDPYDVISNPIYDYIETHKGKIGLSKYSVRSLEQRYPRLSRVICRKKKSATTSAVFASCCFKKDVLDAHYSDSKFSVIDTKWRDRGFKELDWLIANKSPYKGYSWGLPFVWNMGNSVYAPIGTPYSTLSIYMIDAFNEGYYKHFGGKYLDVLRAAHLLFTHQLKKLYVGEDDIVLSYSPLDELKVVNVQSYAAASIYALHSSFSPQYHNLYLADKLINRVLNQQNQDGSWDYWDELSESTIKCVDSLHQVYIIQNLLRCYKVNKDERIKNAVSRAVDFYKKSYFDDGNIRKFPVGEGAWVTWYEIIDVAEAIRMFLMIKDFEKAEECVEILFNNFSTEKPYFLSTVKDATRKKGFDDIPYMRWGQVQAACALGEYLCAKGF